MDINKEISKTIEFLRFPAATLVVILHAYTTLQSTSAMEMPIYTMVSSSLSLGIGEIGVPLFFTISGFLFFINYSPQKYPRKIKSRIRTLLIPYIVWNSLMIIFYFIIQSLPLFTSFFSGNNKPVPDYSTLDFIRAFWDCGNWNNGQGTPILQPYWYIRDLMIINLFSPFIPFFIKHLNYVSFVLPILGWIVTQKYSFTLSTIAFFTLGAWITIEHERKIKMILSNRKFIILGWGITFFFDLFLKNNHIYPYGYYMHRVSIVLAIPTIFSIAWYIKDKVTIDKTITDASFFIYSIHMPLMLAIRKVCIKIVPLDHEIIHIFLYLICTIIIIIVSYKLYCFIKKHTPTLSYLLNGRR